MEKAILKTLGYGDIFDYPLKAWEIHKWLIGKQSSLKQVERWLKKLVQTSKCKELNGYYFLFRRKGLVRERIKREKISKNHFRIARYVSLIFQIIPWIKLVGISGSLAMMGSRKRDDVDLFIITGKNRIWISRLLLVFFASLTGLRRKRREKVSSAAGKICINLILELDNLAQNRKNIYVAHEVLQMQVLWQREDVYSNFLTDNKWVFKLLPNWKSGIKTQKAKNKRHYDSDNKTLKVIDWLEEQTKRLQLKIMGSPDRLERIEGGALYFHPEDKGKKILEEYTKRLKKLSIT